MIRRNLNPTSEQQGKSVAERVAAALKAQSTTPTGVKDLGEDGDVLWTNTDTSVSTSVREQEAFTSQLGSDLANANSLVTQALSDVANNAANVANVANAVSASNANIANVQSNVANVQANVANVANAVALTNANVANVSNAVSASNANITNVQSNVADVQANVANVANSITATNANVANVSNAVNATNANVANVANSVSASNANIANVQANVANVANSVTATNANVANISNSVNATNANVANVQANVANVAKTVSATNANLANVQSNLVATNANVANVANAVTATNANIANAQTNIANAISLANLAQNTANAAASNAVSALTLANTANTTAASKTLTLTQSGYPSPAQQLSTTEWIDTAARTYAWTGAAGNSSSTESVNGAVIRTNLIKDPTFEATKNINIVGGGTVSNDSSWSVSGSNSLLLTPTGASSDVYFHFGSYDLIALPLKPGHTYTFSATIRVKAASSTSAASNGAHYISIWWHVSGGSYANAGSPSVPNTTGAVGRVSVTATIPENVDQVFVRCYHGYTDGATQFDALLLEEGSTLGSYFDGLTTSTPANTRKHWDGLRWDPIVDGTASQALTVANIAQAAAAGLVSASIAAPTSPPTGAIWFPLDASGRVIGMKLWNGTAWTSYVVMADQFVSPGSLGTVSIANSAVTAPIVAANAITANAIAANAVTANAIAANAITAGKIAAGAVIANAIAANAVTAVAIQAGAVTANAVAANAISAITIQAGAVTANAIAANAVTANAIAANSITSAMIQAGAVIANAIGANAVTAAAIQAGAVTANAIGANAVTANSLAANSVYANAIQAGAVTANSIAANAITAISIAAGAVTANAIGANAVTANAIQAGAVTANAIAANAVTAAAIMAGAVTANAIGANAITAGKIDAGAVTAGALAANSIVAADIQAGAVTANALAANSVTAVAIAANAVTANSIAANSVSAADLQAGSVTANSIAAGAVTANAIRANAVTANAIAANAVTANAIAANAVTAQTIQGNAINGMTITGAVIRSSNTVGTTGGTQQDTTGFHGYDANGNEVTRLSSADGSFQTRGGAYSIQLAGNNVNDDTYGLVPSLLFKRTDGTAMTRDGYLYAETDSIRIKSPIAPVSSGTSTPHTSSAIAVGDTAASLVSTNSDSSKSESSIIARNDGSLLLQGSSIYVRGWPVCGAYAMATLTGSVADEGTYFVTGGTSVVNANYALIVNHGMTLKAVQSVVATNGDYNAQSDGYIAVSDVTLTSFVLHIRNPSVATGAFRINWMIAGYR